MYGRMLNHNVRNCKENEVKQFHSELETETIKNSILRHKISFFDSDLKDEIEGLYIKNLCMNKTDAEKRFDQ